MITTRISRVRDWDELGRKWRALEGQVELSFFQSWSWVGCLAGERYGDPWLAEALDEGEIASLALFNGRNGWFGDRLALHESGEPGLDTPFIEHNGIVGPHAQTVLGAVLPRGRPRRLRLGGIDERTLAAVRDVAPWVCLIHSREAPFTDLTRDFLASRSANTRHQLRRSDRAYGEVTVQRAADIGQAHDLLDEMSLLHQASWRARGQPGAFAEPFFGRFHRALIREAMPRGEIDLLRVTAAGGTIGVLYNLRFRGRALAYQSGFDYPSADGPRKPGLTCHHAAIRLSAVAGLQTYDFLAGDARYKRSLSDGSVRLHWAEAGSWLDLPLAARRVATAWRARLPAGRVGRTREHRQPG